MGFNSGFKGLIRMKCAAGEYKECAWTFTGEPFSFFTRCLSASKKKLLFDSRCGYFLCAYNEML